MKQENSKYIYFSSYFFFIFFLSSHLSAVERIIILERSVNNLSFSLSLLIFTSFLLATCKRSKRSKIYHVSLIYIQSLTLKRTRASSSVLLHGRYFTRVVVRRKTGTYTRNERGEKGNKMRGMNNERVCKHNPTFAQQRRHWERGSYGREDKECTYDVGEVGLEFPGLRLQP